MRIGDVVNTGVWITGDEPPEMRARYEHDVSEAIDFFCFENELTYGPVTFVTKHPMDDDVPEVPDHIQGTEVQLLVAEATITGKAVQTSEGSFVANLELSDLNKLRGIIRRHRQLTDLECDEIIEELGPEAALDTLKSLH